MASPLPSSTSRIQWATFDTPLGRWRFAACAPSPRLAPHVELLWQVEGRALYTRERIVPKASVELLFSLRPKHRLIAEDGSGRDFSRAWVSGMQQGPLTVESLDDNRMVGVRLRPLGAFALFGVPMHELAERVLDLDDVLGAQAEGFRARLIGAPDAVERFDLVEGFLAGRLARAPSPDPLVAWSLGAIVQAGGGIRLSELVRTCGVSERRLADKFREQVGLTPKRLARVVRFERVIAHLKGRAAIDWAALAQDFGFYDQSHFVKDFRAFAGASPTEFLRARTPDGDGLVVQ